MAWRVYVRLCTDRGGLSAVNDYSSFHPETPTPRAVTPSTKVVKHAGKIPAVHESAFVAPSASVIGQVTIGKGSSVWYGATLRGTSSARSIVSV